MHSSALILVEFTVLPRFSQVNARRALAGSRRVPYNRALALRPTN